MRRTAWILAVATALVLAAPADAAEIKVLSGTGPRAAVRELIAQFERQSGHTVAVEFHVNAEVRRRIEVGAMFDAVVGNPETIDELIRETARSWRNRASASGAPASASRCVPALPSRTSRPPTHSAARCSPRTPWRFPAKARAGATSSACSTASASRPT